DDTPIAGVTDKVKDTVNKPEDEPEETVNKTVEDPGSVGGTVGGVVDGANGGIAETSKAAANEVNDLTKTLTGKDGKKTGATTGSHGGLMNGSGRYAAAAGRSHDKVFAQSLAARRADAKNRTPIRLSSATTTTTNDSGVIQQIGRVAAEAAQQAAFPLVLTLLVGAFLIGQNRIDRRDPKLAMAPIDSEQDLLSFS
ncbi:MAG TPA: hypothetical protein VG408_04805, partial [Actinomycetota bacterium]|nr:hypothetical protein [Actinomycetota bacterium]